MRSYTVCIFGLAETEEGGRAWMIRTGLAENGIALVSCRTNVDGMWAKYRDLYRIWHSSVGRIDAVHVVFLGYYLMPLAWFLARRRGVPVVLDAFISLYDTEVHDRQRVHSGTPRAWSLWLVDWFACVLADVVVVDTRAHGTYFVEKLYVNPEKIIVVPIGSRGDVFKPLLHKANPNGDFVVEFHGLFIPLQGIEHILEAAEILEKKGERIRFELIGDGQTYPAMRQYAKELGVTNVAFLGTKTHEEVADAIARADICLGIFGTTEKALRVIPNKVYECLSCGKPVITERSPAALEYLSDGEEVLMVSPGNGADLAEKILRLKGDPALRAHLGERARAISLGAFSTRAIVKDLVAWFVALP